MVIKDVKKRHFFVKFCYMLHILLNIVLLYNGIVVNNGKFYKGGELFEENSIIILINGIICFLFSDI